MGIELPQPANIFFPEVPSSLEQSNPDLYEYLQRLKKSLETSLRGYFDNDELIATTINSGTTGTFAITSGTDTLATVIITSGVVSSMEV